MFLRNKPIYSLIHIPCNRLKIPDLNQKPAPSVIMCYNCMFLYTAYLRRPRQFSRHSDLLQAVRSGDRIPMGAKFSAVYQTGAGDRPTSGSFPGVNLPARGLNHQIPSCAEVKERLELNIYSLSVFS